MAENDLRVYAIRRAILRELKRFRGAPVTAAELYEDTPNVTLKVAKAETVAEQWAELQSFGYIEPVPGFGGEYCRITERGLQQVSPEFAPDPFVHGPGAAR